MNKNNNQIKMVLLIGGGLACILSFMLYFLPHKEKTMKLVNFKTKCVLVEFHNDRAIFHDRFLERQMKLRGIAIPPHLREQYEQKTFVKLNDPLFQKAFKEIYYPTYLSSRSYEWRENTNNTSG